MYCQTVYTRKVSLSAARSYSTHLPPISARHLQLFGQQALRKLAHAINRPAVTASLPPPESFSSPSRDSFVSNTCRHRLFQNSRDVTLVLIITTHFDPPPKITGTSTPPVNLHSRVDLHPLLQFLHSLSHPNFLAPFHRSKQLCMPFNHGKDAELLITASSISVGRRLLKRCHWRITVRLWAPSDCSLVLLA